MDPVWIAIAFVLGLAARQIGLPPLVGFLAAGFVLNALGVEGGETLQKIADLGVTFLLFTIGLKLRIQTLLRREVWGGASAHMLITVLVFGVGIFALSAAGLPMFNMLDFKLALLIAFALSFSSTVFAVKVLEQQGEMTSLHGTVSIGILIMQDLFAVFFIVASTGKIPSPWALALVGLIPLRRVLMKVMDRCGHGELLMLFGMVLALELGGELFELVHLKGDLGALVLGVLVAEHPKASELAESLLGFKDLFLVGFFLTIGLSGAPSFQALGVATILVLAVVFKVVLFFFLLTRFRLRARTSILTSLSLANYSEFGLIVAAIGVANGWIADEWLVTLALALSMTFVIASPLNTASHALYDRFQSRLRRFEAESHLPEDEPIGPGDADIIIFGMGRVGTGAYEAMRDRHGERVIGVDFEAHRVEQHKAAGRNVILGDATDSDFWRKTQPGKIRLVMLAMSKQSESMLAVEELKQSAYSGFIAATGQYAEDIEELEAAGVHAAFDIYDEAGAGFADHVGKALEL